VDRHFVGRTFRFYGISNKLVKRKHMLKWSNKNILYTARYLNFILDVMDWTRIKFADEASFCSKGAFFAPAAVSFRSVLPTEPRVVWHAQLCVVRARGRPRAAKCT
jgi:hypothetical protein